MLYLVEIALKEAKITCVRLNGSLNLKERKSILSSFETDPEVAVLLISIGATVLIAWGKFNLFFKTSESYRHASLNITAASHVHFIEPQWNPMVESQALDRVYRLGQQNLVKPFRCIMKSSFDEVREQLRYCQQTLVLKLIRVTVHAGTSKNENGSC